MFAMVQYKDGDSWTEWKLADLDSDGFKEQSKINPVRVLLDSNHPDAPNVALYYADKNALYAIKKSATSFSSTPVKMFTQTISYTDPTLYNKDFEDMITSAKQYLKSTFLTEIRINQDLQMPQIQTTSKQLKPLTHEETRKQQLLKSHIESVGKCLNDIVGHHKDRATQIDELKKFLKDHYRFIKGTELDYLVTPNSPVTMLLKDLAQQIASETNEPFEDIMMPVGVLNNSSENFLGNFPECEPMSLKMVRIAHSEFNTSHNLNSFFRNLGEKRAEWYVGKIVKNPNDLLSWYDKLDLNNRQVLLQAMKDHWKNISKDVTDSSTLLTRFHKYPNVIPDIIEAISENLTNIITVPNGLQVLIPSLEMLDLEQATSIIKSIKLSEKIEKPFFFSFFVMQHLSPKLRKVVYEEMKETLPSMVKDFSDLCYVLQYLTLEQSKAVCEAFKKKADLPNIQVGDFNKLVSNLSYDQFKYICDLYKAKLPQIAPNLTRLLTDETKKLIFQKAVIQARLEKYKARIQGDTPIEETPNYARGIWFSTQKNIDNRRLSYELAVKLLYKFPKCTTLDAFNKALEELLKDKHAIKSSELRSIINDLQSIVTPKRQT